MQSAVDILAAPATLNMGIKHSVPVRAAVWGIGVFNLAWKEARRIPLPPGDHVVAVWAQLVRKPRQGISHARLHLEPGQLVGLEWQMPGTLFGTGPLVARPVGPPTGQAYLDATPFPPDLGPCRLYPPHPVEPLTAIAPAPAAGAWHPDPTGRFALRWWDGARWTDAVSDGTTTGSDPVPGL